MGTIRCKTERAPRCMGTLFTSAWSRWAPSKRPPKNAPNRYFQMLFGAFWRHEEWTGAALRPSRTSAMQHGSTHAVKNHQYTLGFSIFCISGICKRAPHSVAWVRSNLGARYITTIQSEFTDSPICVYCGFTRCLYKML